MRSSPADLDDFCGLYRTHYGFVWHALHRFGVDGTAIDDAVQDVFVVAFRRWLAFDGPSVKAWLYGIARRIASNHRRARRRRLQRAQALCASLGGRSPTAIEAVVRLDRYLASLRPEDRELFVLSEVEGMTGPELARALGRNLQTIYTRTRKLRAAAQGEFELGREIAAARPRASHKGWLLLVPSLRSSVVPLAGWSSLLPSTWIPIAAVVGLTIAGSWPSNGPSQASPAIATAHAAIAVPASAEPSPRPIVAPVPIEQVAPSPAALPRAVRSPRRTPSPAAAPSKTDPSLDIELLDQAAARLRADAPEEALRLIDEHARTFPASSLDDLRAALRIDALCAAGKIPQAHGEARSFAMRHPSSPLNERVRKSCSRPS